MRNVVWVSVAATFCFLVQPALGQYQTGSEVASCAGCLQGDYYAAPACSVPIYGHYKYIDRTGWAPGCCRCAPSKCDHVWDGFCQEKCHPCWGMRGALPVKATCSEDVGCGTATADEQMPVATPAKRKPVITDVKPIPAAPVPAPEEGPAMTAPKDEAEKPAEKTTFWPRLPRLW